MKQEAEDTTECESCEKSIPIYEAFYYCGLCQECWVEERNLQVELEDRTASLPGGTDSRNT